MFNFSNNLDVQQHQYAGNYGIEDLSSTSPQKQIGTQDPYTGNVNHGLSYKADYSSPGKIGYFVPGDGTSGVNTTNMSNTSNTLPPYPMNTVKDYSPVITTNNVGNGSVPSYNMTKIRPPKGYNGPVPNKLNIDYGSYKTSERNDPLQSQVVDPPLLIASKPAIYKPRHNISEKDLQREGRVAHSSASATQDFTENSLPRELMSKMFGLLKENMFCDAVLVVGQKEIRIHKLVLMAACPSLLSKMRNPRVGESVRLKLPSDIPIEVASQCVHYLYDSRVTLTSQNVAQFARIGKLFNLEHLLRICQEFVNNFSLDKSLLNVPNEDIMISVVNASDSFKSNDNKINEVPKQQCTNTETSDSNSVLPKKTHRDVTISEEPKSQLTPSPSKPTHLYGTRLASGSVKKRVLQDEIQDIDIFSNQSKITPGKSLSAVSSNNERNKDETGDTQKPLSDSTNLQSTHILSHPRKRRLSLLAQEAQDMPLEESDILEDLDEYDDDEEYQPPTQMITQSGMQRAVFEGTKRGKTLKNLKKSTAYIQAVKKNKKKSGLLLPSQNKSSTVLRPPPKKRLREFTEKQSKETEIKEIEDFLKADEPTAKFPSDKHFLLKGLHKKTLRPEVNILAGIGKYTSELEKKAADIAVNERCFICNLCQNEFVFPKRCITHVVRTHDLSISAAILEITVLAKKDNSKKKCEICGYESKEKHSNYNYLHYHKYFRHGIPLPKGWKPFTCDVCGKECFTKFQLKDHKLIHVEATPFVCETCGTGFKSRTCLNSHVYHKHNTLRKHVCNSCDRAFKTKTQLQVHERTHTGERPFRCPDCNGRYRSTTRGNLRLHLTNYHKYAVDVINKIMSELQPSIEDPAETEQALKEVVKPPKPQKKSTTKKTPKSKDSNIVPNINNSVMVLNDQGQVNVLDNVKYIESDLTKPMDEPPLESLHPTITHMLNEPLPSNVSGAHTHHYSSGGASVSRQSLLKPYSMTGAISTRLRQTLENSNSGSDDDDDDDEPQQLVINTDQFSPNSSQYEEDKTANPKISAEFIQDQNLALLTEENIGYIRNVQNINSELANQILVQDLKPVEKFKTFSNDQILQFVTQPPQANKGEFQSYSASRTDPNVVPNPVNLPSGLQVHLQNILQDKNHTLVQLQIQQPSTNPEQQVCSIAPKSAAQPVVQSAIPVELVPVSLKSINTNNLIPAQYYYSKVASHKSQEKNIAATNSASSVGYIMQQPQDGIDSENIPISIFSNQVFVESQSARTSVAQSQSQNQNFTDSTVYQIYQGDNFQGFR